jgi:hypothetical protein
MKDTNVPVEKWAEYRNLYLFDEELTVVRAEAIDKFSGDYYVGRPVNITALLSQSIQSAVEERVKRIVKEVKKLKSKEKTSIHDFSYDMAINDALSIINNQPLNK